MNPYIFSQIYTGSPFNQFSESTGLARNYPCSSTSPTIHRLGVLLNNPIKHLREVHTDRYGIRTILEVDGIPIKVEFVREDRIQLSGYYDEILSVPILAKTDMYSEKLLANADRGLDKFVKSRDLINLAMMIEVGVIFLKNRWIKCMKPMAITRSICSLKQLNSSRIKPIFCLA